MVLRTHGKVRDVFLANHFQDSLADPRAPVGGRRKSHCAPSRILDPNTERVLSHLAHALCGAALIESDLRLSRSLGRSPGIAGDAGALRNLCHRDLIETPAREEGARGIEDSRPLVDPVLFALRRHWSEAQFGNWT